MISVPLIYSLNLLSQFSITKGLSEEEPPLHRIDNPIYILPTLVVFVHIEEFDPVCKAVALLDSLLNFSKLITVDSHGLDLIVKKTLHYHNMKREELT